MAFQSCCSAAISSLPLQCDARARHRNGGRYRCRCRLRAVAAGVAGPGKQSGSLIVRQLAFWREALAGLPERIELPDRPPPKSLYQPTRRRGPAAAWHGPFRERRASRPGVCVPHPLLVLQAAVAALLTGLARGPISRLAVRPPVAVTQRWRMSLDSCQHSGAETNTSGNPTFRELIGRVRAVDLAAYANQAYRSRNRRRAEPGAGSSGAIRCSRFG